VGSGPCVLTRGSDVHHGSRDARRGFNLAPSSIAGPRGPVDATASNLDTLLDRGVGRRVRMLLSFQRPSHLFGKVFPSHGASKTVPISERTGEYSARSAVRGRNVRRAGEERPPGGKATSAVRGRNAHRLARAGKFARGCGQLGRLPRTAVLPVSAAARESLRRIDAYDRTCTVTVRCRGRSSKSISTTCCQVPSRSRPSTIGIVSDGPITAARRWAWEFVSWLRRLCS